MNKSRLKQITGARLFLPIVCLIAVLLINVIKTPDFFHVSIQNGVLYGYIIDVINRASELVILAVGMTLVTAASGGQDISVGAVMAVAAAVCCQILSGGQASVTEYQNSIILAVVAALLASALCGAFNGFLVARLRIQPMGSNVDPVYGRTWYRTACYSRTDYLCPCGFLQNGRRIHRKMSDPHPDLFCSDHSSGRCPDPEKNSSWSLYRKCWY